MCQLFLTISFEILENWLSTFFYKKYHIFATKYHKTVFSGENLTKKREERCSSDRFSFCLKKEILKDAIEETNTAHLLIAP